MRYSDGAVRRRNVQFEDKFRVGNIRERTVNSLNQQFNLDRQQAQRVCQTANGSVKKTAPIMERHTIQRRNETNLLIMPH